MLYSFKRIMRALYSIKETVDKSRSMVDAIKPILMIIAIVIIQALIGKMLWNKALVPAVSIAKPLKHWYDVIALSLLFNMINL